MSRQSICEKFFIYHGPAKKPNNSLYVCNNCPPLKDGEPNYLSCSDSSRGNLKKHLASKHPGLVDSFDKACASIQGGVKRKQADVSLSNPAVQSTIEESFSVKKKKLCNHPSQDEFDDMVIKYIVDSLLPIRHVESEPFRQLMSMMGPGLNVMCRQTLTSKIEKRFVEGKRKLAMELFPNITEFCTTADVWKSRGRSYLGVTGHWLDHETLNRHGVCLGIRRLRGSLTYDVIGKALKSVHDEFRISKKVVVTITDSGSNFLKAFRMYSKGDSLQETPSPDIEYIEITEIFGSRGTADQRFMQLPAHRKCAAHLLNLVATTDVLAANEQDDYYASVHEATFGKLQMLFNKQSRSTLFSDKVKDHLGVLFVIPNATRWNSMFDAVRHVWKLIADCPDESECEIGDKNAKARLNELCEEHKIPRFTCQDFLFIEEYVQVMTPLAHALDVIQGEGGKTITAGHLLPTLTVIRRSLQTLKSNRRLLLLEPVADSILRGIEKRFYEYINEEDLQLASAIHPKFKFNWLEGETEENLERKKQSIRKNLEKRVLTLHEKANDIRHANQSVTKLPSPEEPNDFFSTLKPPKVTNNSDLEIKDISAFFDRKPQDDLIEGFKDLPLLKKIFINLNTALPSSAAVERLFSLSGRVLCPTRTLLSDEHFEMLVFLKSNSSFF